MFRLSSILLTLTLFAATLCGGCSRAFFREQADRDVHALIDEKNNDPRWFLPRTDISTNDQSRLFNFNDPDCPPLPPGDEAADELMLRPGGYRGASLWHELPKASQMELDFRPWEMNMPWVANSEQMKKNQEEAHAQFERLSLAQAVELSLIHSREYQRQLENLYLAALNLTFERYRFRVRPLGLDGLEPGSALSYRQGPNGASQFQLGNSLFGLSRLFPSGAQFIGELVNNTIWIAGGPNSTTSATSLAFSLVQPLMRGGGRKVVLEDLTQAERNLLYAVRDFARFRKQFFVSTITGGQVAGLQRFLRGFEFLGGSGAPSVGFFPVLLRLQQLRNRQYIARTLEYLIEDLKAAGASALDIARLESTLADTRGDLYADQRVYEDNRDQYKVQLGLPPDLSVTLDDSLLKPFQFVDPSLIQLEQKLRNLAVDLRKDNADRAAMLRQFKTMANEAAQGVKLIEADMQSLEKVFPAKMKILDENDSRQLQKIINEEKLRFATVKKDVEQIRQQIQALQKMEPAPRDPNAEPPESEKLRLQLLVRLRRLGSIQIVTRVELIPIQPFDIELGQGVELALENRLDLMNRRARVTDARRNLEIAANQLQSQVDIVGDATVATKPLFGNNKPLDFRARQSSYGIGIQFDTPLDRVAERNRFRASQIAYNQAKRGYVGAEDNVKLEVRQAIRTLKQLEQTLVQRRRRVQYAARELDLAESKSAASQRGLSLNNALRTINRAQDELIETWLDYETTRLNLYRDLGTMQIDERGFWSDEFYQQMAEEDLESGGDQN